MTKKNSLVIFTQAARMLADADTIQKAKELKSLALTAADWARRKNMGAAAIQHCRSYALEAERKMGEMLRETARAKGAKGIGPIAVPSGNRNGPPTLAELGVSKRESVQAQALVTLPEQTFCAIKAGTLTRVEAWRALQREKNAALRADLGQRNVTFPQGKYACLVVDPPWSMEKIERDQRPNQTGFDYPTMREDDLEDFPVAQYAADDAHLYLWTTHRFLPTALRLCETWGFHYQCLLTWIKNVGFTPYSWMYSTEHVLFCTQGNLPLLKLGQRLDFQAKVREHSRKPEAFYALVETVSPGPYLDVFSREARTGWAQLCNEGDKYHGRLAG